MVEESCMRAMLGKIVMLQKGNEGFCFARKNDVEIELLERESGGS